MPEPERVEHDCLKPAEHESACALQDSRA